MPMAETELTLKLRPWQDGAFTLVSLEGPIATVVQPKEMRRLLMLLSWWSGAPVDVVLCVDGTNSGACWLEVWDDVLGRIRGRHLYRQRLLTSRETLAAEGGHDQ